MRHLLALLSIFTFLTSSTLHAQPPSYVPTDGLVGWWPFNSNANDESGNGNNGTVNSGTSLTADRFGVSNRAYAVDGVDCPSARGINLPAIIPNSFDYSISIWYFSNNQFKEQQSFINSFPHAYICLSFNHGFAPNNEGAFMGNGGWLVQANSANWTAGQLDNWIHIIAVKDGSSFKFYQNGSLVYNQPLGPGFNNGSISYFVAGALSINGGSNCYEVLSGGVDDIGIWNRALTPAEIQALYTGQGSSPCVSPTAVSFTGLATSYTTSAGPVTLAGTPASGVFIGPGVTGSTFSPAVAGEGTHSISYTYLDGDNCVNTSSLCTSVSLGMGLEPGGNAPGGVRVFPNPNRGQFTVELELAGLVGLQVFDARGALVHNEVFTASGGRTQRTLDLSAFAKGSYTLLVEHDGQRVSQTVVVE
jgi:hypothetical protein